MFDTVPEVLSGRQGTAEHQGIVGIRAGPSTPTAEEPWFETQRLTDYITVHATCVVGDGTTVAIQQGMSLGSTGLKTVIRSVP